MVKLYGVEHLEAKDMKELNLDDFTLQLATILHITIPAKAENKEEAVKKAILKKAKEAEEANINMSWIQNPDRLGQ